MINKPLVTVETMVHADARTVWRVLTAPKSAMFMGADVDTDWEPGSPISFTGEFKGQPFRDHGKIRDVVEQERLAFTHYSPSSGKPDEPDNYNYIDIWLEPEGDRTRVKLSQTPLGDDRPDEETVAEYRKNWEVMLGGLRKAAEERVFAQG